MAFAQILPSSEQKYVQCFLESDRTGSGLAWALSPVGNTVFQLFVEQASAWQASLLGFFRFADRIFELRFSSVSYRYFV